MSLKLMAVDNDPQSLRLIRALATELGSIPFTSDNYEAAADRAMTQHFDILFVAAGIPATAGLALVRRIRESQFNVQSTVVMLSPNEDIATLRQAFSEGADFVLSKPIVANRLRVMLSAMNSPGWQGKRSAARMPLFTDVKCIYGDHQFPLRSVNISETGMLLQPAVDVQIGHEVALEFAIPELGASLNIFARVVRKHETQNVGVEFIGLTPEDHNAIQLYVLGHLKDLAPTRSASDTRMRRLFNP